MPTLPLELQRVSIHFRTSPYAMLYASMNRPIVILPHVLVFVVFFNKKKTQAIGNATVSSSFAPTSHALRLMETLAASAQACEPVLLVGCAFYLFFFVSFAAQFDFEWSF